MIMGKMQLGKNGITNNFIATLTNQFKNHENVKISVLKSAREDKTKTKKYAEEIIKKLGPKFTAKVIGHTIAVKKWRKAREQVL